MIRVTKPGTGPAILRNRGAATTRNLCALYNASPEDYRDGTKTFSFDPSIYSAKSVKNALRKVQHDKEARQNNLYNLCSR
jgi:hypothetical protein